MVSLTETSNTEKSEVLGNKMQFNRLLYHMQDNEDDGFHANSATV